MSVEEVIASPLRPGPWAAMPSPSRPGFHWSYFSPARPLRGWMGDVGTEAESHALAGGDQGVLYTVDRLPPDVVDRYELVPLGTAMAGLIIDHADNLGVPVELYKQTGGDLGARMFAAALFRNPRGVWQLSYFDEGGPFSHTEGEPLGLVYEAWLQGYRRFMPGAVDAIVDPSKFVDARQAEESRSRPLPPVAPVASAPRWAGILLVDPDGRVLLAKRSWGVSDPHLWAIPGGGIEAGEEPLEAALREFEEEMGRVPELKVLGQLDNRRRGLTFVARTDEEFRSTLNRENTAWEWADPLDPPRPTHPLTSQVLRALAGAFA